MEYIRFTLTVRHPESGIEDGLFRVAYALSEDPMVEVRDREELSELLRWFDANLKTPDRFNRSRSKGYYRRKARGIAWFRDTAVECLARMHQLKHILEEHGHHVTVIRQARIGYAVYEDSDQVVAEPFAETRTGSKGGR